MSLRGGKSITEEEKKQQARLSKAFNSFSKSKNETSLIQLIKVYSDIIKELGLKQGELVSKILFKNRSITQLKSSELQQRIRDMKAMALPAAMIELEYYMRGALAFSALLLALLGALIGIRLKSPKKAVGVGVAVLMVIVYYLCFTVCIHMAESGWMAPAVASWLPNILCVVGILFAG